MASCKDCKHYPMCGFAKYVKTAGKCLDFIDTSNYVVVVRCKDCFANECCSIQIDLDMGGEGYCSKGRKEI